MGGSFTERSAADRDLDTEGAPSSPATASETPSQAHAPLAAPRRRVGRIVAAVVAALLALLALIWAVPMAPAGRAAAALALLVGAAVGGAAVWFGTRAALRAAHANAESVRARLLSVERNQALWVSLSAVLHDVRNPLHNINLLVELLGSETADVARVRTQIAHELERIQVRMRRVATQASEFLSIERRPVALHEILSEVDGMIRPLAKQAGVAFVFQCATEIKVMADPKFLLQAIDHLLLNSLQILVDQRGGERARKLTVTTVRAGAEVALTVEDTGPGLPESVRNHPFEPLMSSRSSGMGIGLTIAHALTRAAGGDLRIARTDSNGTQFHLMLKPA